MESIPFPCCHTAPWEGCLPSPSTIAWGPCAATTSQHVLCIPPSPLRCLSQPGSPLKAAVAKGARHGRLVGWLLVWIQPPAALPPWLPFLPGPASQIRNTPSFFLSESPGAFQALRARRSGGWVGITNPSLQASSPGSSTGGWMLLCFPLQCWPSRGEDSLASS